MEHFTTHDLLITHCAHNLPEKPFFVWKQIFFYIFEFPFLFRMSDIWYVCRKRSVWYSISFFSRTVLTDISKSSRVFTWNRSDFDVFLLFRQYFEFVMNWNWKWNNWKIAFHLLPPCQYRLLFLFWLENTHKLYRAC